MQKLAKVAGVNEIDLSWLREPLELMMFELQCQKSSPDLAPSWPNRIKHLRATLSAARKLEALLRPEWVSVEMGRFESRELKLKMLGSRGGVYIKTSADGKRAREWMRAASVVEGDAKRDVGGVDPDGIRIEANFVPGRGNLDVIKDRPLTPPGGA